jgi:beta-glucosidase
MKHGLYSALHIAGAAGSLVHSAIASSSARLSAACAIAITVATTLQPVPSRAQPLPWMDTSLSPEQRAALLVAAMTLDEKIEQIAMNTGPNPDLPGCGVRFDSRHIEGMPRLAIPTIRMTNGPIGVSGGDCNLNPSTTGVPTALAIAASWDPAESFAWGDIAGMETRAIGHHVLLAPGQWCPNVIGRRQHN